jgi:hypothetical protein
MSGDGASAGDRLLLESRRQALGELLRLQAGGEKSFEYSSESDVPLSESKRPREGLNLEDSLDSLDTLDRALAVSLRRTECGYANLCLTAARVHAGHAASTDTAGPEQRSERAGILEWERENASLVQDPARQMQEQHFKGSAVQRAEIEMRAGQDCGERPAEEGHGGASSNLEEVDKWRWEAAVQVKACMYKSGFPW